MKQEKFSIRKTTVGAVSARIAVIGFLAFLGTGQSVKADETGALASETVDVETSSQIEEVQPEQYEQELQALDQAIQEAEVVYQNAVESAQTTAQAVQEQTQLENDAQIKVDEAEEAVRVADTARQEAERAKQDTAAEVEETQATKAEAERAVKEAEAAAESTAETIATKLEELEKAAQDEAKQPSTIIQTEVYKSVNHAQRQEERRTNQEWLEGVTYNGFDEVVIELTPDQQAEVEAGQQPTYIPNNRSITEHMVRLINEIRELNNLPGRVTVGDEVMEAYLNARIAEWDRRDAELPENIFVSDHYTELRSGNPFNETTIDGDVYTSGLGRENITYEYGRDLLSDEEVAYALVFGWFSDYFNGSVNHEEIEALVHRAREIGFDALTTNSIGFQNQEGRLLDRMLGHAFPIVTVDGPVYAGFASAAKDPEVKRSIFFSYASENSRTETNLNKSGRVLVDDDYRVVSQEGGIVTTLNEAGQLALRKIDGSYVLSVDGVSTEDKPELSVITFLPQRTFTYVINREVAAPTPAADALADYQLTAQELQKEADEVVETATNALNEATAKVESATTVLTSAINGLQEAEATYQQALSTSQQASAEQKEAESILRQLESSDQQAQEAQQKALDNLESLREQRLKTLYDSIVAKGQIPVPVRDQEGRIVDYTAQSVQSQDTPTEESATTPEVTEEPSSEEVVTEPVVEEEVSAIPDYAPEEEALPEYVFDPADFQDVLEPSQEEISDKESSNQAGGAGAALGQDKPVVSTLSGIGSADRPVLTATATASTYSRTARATAEKSLPNTGDSSALLSLVGFGLTAFGFVGRKRRQG